VKLTTLLAQYLYTNHRLDLPGIGSFILDPSSISAIENSKQRSATLDGVSFEANSTLKEPTALLEYISSQSGKMKALAIADLESHIQLAQQFLNIGKPFTFDGIGTLVRLKPGVFEFVPLSINPDKIKLHSNKDKSSASLEGASAKYESFLSSPKTSSGWGKPVVALLIIAGIGLAIWGGYTISREAATNDTTEVSETPQLPPAIVAAEVDSTPVEVKVEPPKAQNYKYVLQVSKKQTAYRRFNQLKTNLWDVNMETQDSVNFKLFVLLPINHSDTTRVLDSLTVMTGKKVYIEHQN
jgi:hypothetical protein